MGRHSAAEPEPEAGADTAPDAPGTAGVTGDTGAAGIAWTTGTAGVAGTASAPGAGADGRTDAPDGTAAGTVSGGRADLQLLRADGWLRVRCSGAVVLIFLVYTAVLMLIGRRDVYVIWLWVPIVCSGVAVGGFLDAAHRARSR